MNGEIRDREMTMKGINKMGTAIRVGYQQYHEYFREHAGQQGRTPAEAAGIRIGGKDKILMVIQNATKAAN